MTTAATVVGFVGLDDISLDLAASLVTSGYTVKAFDSQNDSPSAVGFSKRFGGRTCASAMEAATGVTALVLLISRLEQINELILGPNGVVKVLDKNAAVILRTVVLPAEVQKLEKCLTDVEVLVIMVTNEAQAESVLFGDLGAVQALSPGASIILSSTVSPAYVSQLEQRLQGNKLKLVDAPVSGGVVRASAGTLTVMASGTDEALEYCASVLAALSEKLYIIKGGCGSGSCVKMVNQLLAGVHIASAAEALAFGARLGLYTRDLFHFVTSSAETSWMLENRGPHMVNNDFTPYSALNIFVKDLGIISHEGSSRKIPLHVAVTAHQLFLSGSAAGWGSLDDAAVVKVLQLGGAL